MKTSRVSILLATCAAGVLPLTGCAVNKQVVISAQSFAHEVGDEYTEYVRADATLSGDQKQDRIDRVEAQQSLMDEAASTID